MIVTIMLVLFVVFLLIGAPVAVAMGLSAVIALVIEGQVPLILLPQKMFTSLDSFSLLAVPLFIYAGVLMNTAGITERIVSFARAAIGHIKGGLSQVTVLASMLFAGISGSAAADAAAVGSMLIPAMIREGYRRDFSVAVTASAAILGPIIPPSIIAIVYASLTGVSIGALFLAGVFPGVLAGGAMMLVNRIVADRVGARTVPRSSAKDVLTSFLRTGPALLMPLIIIVGIVSGVFTATEAGAVAVLYGIVVGVIMRTVTASGLYREIVRAAVMTGSALIVLGGAALFSWLLVRGGVARETLEFVTGVTDDPNVAMIIIIAFLFFVGLFVETLAGMILVVPLLAPTAQTLGLDPVHFGIVTIMMLMLGTITPPVGLLAMLACSIGEIEYSRTWGMLMPYIAILLVVILLVAFVPALSLWLPSMLLG